MNLQDVVDELAETLGRSVTIDDTDSTAVAASGPRAVPRRFAVPIGDEGGRLGTLWLAADHDRPLTSAQYSVIDVAAGAARQILSQETTGAPEDSSHNAVMLRLLADDPAVRRRAFAHALTRRWIERGDATLVRAVAVDPGAGGLHRLAFGRHMAALKSVDLTFIGHRDDILFFIGRAALSDRSGAGADVASDLIRQEARARGLRLLGIGTARLDRKDEDLSVSAEHARRAAEIVAWLPHLDGVADISQLGAWVLLDSIDADGAHVGMFSPAALQLWEHGNDVQLETVETFLDTCGRVRDACEQLHIHRTTLYYRLDNLPDAVRAALNEGMSRSALHICLKLLRYWKAIGRV
jgi:hypothetical protein